MSSPESRGHAIQAFQAAEIEYLARAAPGVASAESLRPHYTRVGEWLPGGLGGSILELGCGPGRYVALLASLGFQVTGVDPFPYPTWDVIRAARPVELMAGVKAEALPFADASFDHVACLGALLYFQDPAKALAEMRRVMRPGGRLFVRTVNRRNLSRRWRGSNLDPAAPNYYDEAELAAFLRDGGFEVHETLSYGFFPPVFRAYWWYLCNGSIPIRAQEWLSSFTPRGMRVNVAAFARLPEGT